MRTYIASLPDNKSLQSHPSVIASPPKAGVAIPFLPTLSVIASPPKAGVAILSFSYLFVIARALRRRARGNLVF